MRDHCAALWAMLHTRQNLTIADIMSELNMSEDTARRWIDSFSDILPIRVERGRVIVGVLHSNVYARQKT